MDQDHINNVVRMRRRMFLNLPHLHATPIGTDKDLARHPHHADLAQALFTVVEIEVSVRIQVTIANLAYKMI